MATAPDSTDVCILGGGLAGLTLAHQLRDRCPGLDVTVLEHRRFPVPEAAHKVGESTVEIAAHYLAEDLGLREHLESCHLPKFGLRLFFSGEHPPMDLAKFDEVGASRVLPVPSYQIDRGILENHLAETARQRGIRVLHGTTVREVSPKPGRHRVRFGPAAAQASLHSRYLIDTSGRRAWLRRQRGAARDTRHANCATWFRVEGDIDVEQWTRNPAWLARCHGTERRLSTNHFMGPGYWVWVIPLASGATSVGVVYDPSIIDPAAVSGRETVRAWLEREQPLLAANIAEARLLDFHTIRDYSVGARRLYGDDGALASGDAVVFADPFYSPGGDFIAIGNTFATEIVARREAGAADPTSQYQRYLLSFFANTLSLYRGQYPGFGHRDLMTVKTAWDYAYYWAVLAKLYFSRRLLDVDFMTEVNPHLLRAATLNAGMQRGFRELATRRRRQGGEGRFVDHYSVPWFHALKIDLLRGDDEHAGTALTAGVSRLAVLANSLHALLGRVEADQALPALNQVPGLE